MFNGNKLAIILPVLLMGFIFYGGYHYLQSTNVVTNEQLHQSIDFNHEMNRLGETVELIGSWEWLDMPHEGLIGEDYIGVSLTNIETGEFIPGDEVVGSELQLFHGHKLIYETVGQVVDNGLIFSYPNEIIEHESYGNKGGFKVSFASNYDSEYRASFTYLHTWNEHEGLKYEDARMISPVFSGTINESYWVIERTIEE
ncbi:hypothetical protein [Bacillus sp. FJAT-45350]|uniref:hypothetical protein n=1 Tax=Bacillus sp. FJAT-45350 TaxID=2011014 RepID=UPI000BB6A73A|nr:hypothetical protein [Bacillus sp. FJAT-45350]